MKTSILACLALFLLMIPSLVHADKASDCEMMVENAIAFFNEKGTEYTLKVLNTKGPFTDREMYVFALSMDNVMLAHPYRKDLIGQNMTNYKDAKGNAVFVEFKRVAEQKGAGWVEHGWPKSGETGEFPMRSFIKKVPRHDIYIGAGYYKEP